MLRRGLGFVVGVSATAVMLAGCENQQTTDDDIAEQEQALAQEEVTIEEQSEDPADRIKSVRLSTDALRVRPDWVSNPGMGGVLGAVGVAEINDLGTRFQVEEARFAARLEIARMLETRVQSAGRDETNQNIRASRDGDEISRSSDSTHEKLGIDRRITDIVLAGSRQRGLWVDPETGVVYVWIVMDGKVLDAVEHTVANGVSIFVAIQRIMTEYVPPRPELIVEIEGAPERPAPQPDPLTPVEELEEKLNELESQPITSGDGTEGDG